MVQPTRSDGTYTFPSMVLRLDKAQQGTPDAGYRWEMHRNDTCGRFGWNVLKTEPSAYYIENHNGSKYARLLASTADFVISSNCIAFLAEQRDKLVQEWQIAVQFPVTQHAGIKIVRTPKYKDMSAPKHIEALSVSQGMENCNPATTPTMDSHDMATRRADEPRATLQEIKGYQRAVGAARFITDTVG
jgi:hypothetical protein